MTLRIGSLFTGTGALDLAVMDVYDAEVVWHSQYEPPDKNGKEDKNQYAAKILARHWPDVPNLGDVAKIDWQAVLNDHGPIDILTGGFPCQDVSSAGRRIGLTPVSRSGLWNHMAHAISILQPKLVVIENVEGLLSAPAASDVEPCPWCLGDGHTEPVLRACGAVLGDLASLGFDAEWGRYGADEVGAPHRRRRIIIRAWPADAHTADIGHERCRDTRRRGNGPANCGLAAAHTSRLGLEVGGVEPDRDELPAAERGRGESASDAQGAGLQGLRPEPAGRGSERGRAAAADSDGFESERRGVAGVLGGQAAAEPREGDQRERAGHATGDSRKAAADTDGRRCEGDQERHGGPVNGQPEREPRLDPVGRGARRETVEAGPELGHPGEADADSVGCRADVLDLRPGEPDLDWGDYEPAIRRWERVLGRPAPWPTDALGRLSPVFTEWLMGLPDGWVTDTPGLTRPAMLRALGNGVVWQQAAYAIRDLHQRATADQLAAA